MSNRPAHASRVWAVAAVWMIGLGGCVGLFRPATPPTPEPGTEIELDYSDPSATLATLAKGLAAKGLGNGLSAYIGAFADSATDGFPYYAYFDPELARRRRVPTWNLSMERAFYSSFILVNNGSYNLRWITVGGDDVDQTNGIARLSRHYEVFATSTVDDRQSLIAVGFADLELRRITIARWAIVLWRDRADPTADPTDVDQITLGARRLDSQGTP